MKKSGSREDIWEGFLRKGVVEREGAVRETETETETCTEREREAERQARRFRRQDGETKTEVEKRCRSSGRWERREKAAMCVVGLKFKREGKRWFDDQSH